MIISSPGARLARVGGRHFLFSPERQLLFEAEPAIARIWPDLERGMSAERIVRIASSAGADGAQILSDLVDSALVEAIAPKSGPVEIEASFRLCFNNIDIGLHATGPRAATSIRETWGYLEAPWDRCDEHLVVLEGADHAGLGHPGEEPDWVDWTGIGPAIKISLTDIVLDALDELVLHVATLAAGDEALLLCGAPGDGKSTLSVALDAAKTFRLEGDDLASLSADGRVRAIPFPATIKSGAWPILGGDRPDLPEHETFRRPDDQVVRYLPLRCAAPPPRPVACVLCLDRSPGARPRLEAMPADAAIGALLQGGWSQDRRLSPEAFAAVAACVDKAHFFRMSYAKLDDAVALAQEAWRIAAGKRAWTA